MHELAVIVGEEVTVRDLVPVFDQFLGDLDEVRIGVLKHLADFIKVELSMLRVLRTASFIWLQ
jgi:serine/threonine-protein phosphatase 4 regulatory subunit 1